MGNNRVNLNRNDSNPYPYFDANGIGTPYPFTEPPPAAPSPVYQPAAPPVYYGNKGPVFNGPADNSYSYPVGTRRGLGGDFLLNLIFVGILWQLWICLYPLSLLAGLFTLVYAMPFLRGVLPESSIIGPGLYAVILGCGAALVALWTMSRLEEKLARHAWYRVARHVVRLPLLGMGAVVAIERVQGRPYNPALSAIMPILRVPAYLAIVIGVMVAFHFILWNWSGARAFWHRRLAGARLRSSAV